MAERSGEASLRLMLAQLAVADKAPEVAAPRERLATGFLSKALFFGRLYGGAAALIVSLRRWMAPLLLWAKQRAAPLGATAGEYIQRMLRCSRLPQTRGTGESLRGGQASGLFAAAVLSGRGRVAVILAAPLYQWAAPLRFWANVGDAAVSPSTTASLRKNAAGSLIAVAALVGGVGGWAATAEFAGAVIAPGSVVVDSNVKKLQHPTGGVVDELRVRDGDRVKAGDILIRLDQTQAAVNLAIIVKGLDELLVRQARLEAERDGLDAVDFAVELLARALEDVELGKIVSAERRVFESRRTSRRGQQLQLKERISQLGEQILGLDEQIGAKKREIMLIERELVGVQELHQKKLIPIQRVTALERDAARIEGEHGAMVASIAQTKARITETELQILQIDQDLRTEVGRELAEIRAKIAELSERKVGAEDQMRRIDIRAPRDGAVHQLAVHTIGGVIGAGEALMLIVPDAEELSVEVRLPPERIDQVRAGQPAVLRFSAFDQRTTPEVNGEVSRVSADLLTDQRTGIPYYSARITIPAAEAQRLGQKLLPGMPVEAFVHTGDRTVLTYLTKPLTDQMRRAFRER